MPVISRRHVAVLILLVACGPAVAWAQVGRIFVSVEAYVGLARMVHVGRIVELKPIAYDKPLTSTQKLGRPYRLVFEVDETIRGQHAKRLELVLSLQSTHGLAYLRDQEAEILLVGGPDSLHTIPRAEVGIEEQGQPASGEWYQFRLLEPLAVPESAGSAEIASQINEEYDSCRMFTSELEIVEGRQAILERARTFANKNTARLPGVSLIVPNEFGALVGSPNAYCAITLPIGPDTKKTLTALKDDPGRILRCIESRDEGNVRSRLLAETDKALLHFASATGSDDLPIGVFKGDHYDGWTAEGAAFAPGPVTGDMLRTLEIESAPEEASVACSEVDGDRPIGTLTSPEFVIERKFIAFTVGGGNYERHTCVDLLVDGKVVRSATGWRSDRLTPVCWNVADLAGRTANVQLVDRASGDWGHINTGPIWQTDSPAAPPTPVAPLYSESLRPQFHFTARQWTMNRLNPREREEGWLNDLNGLIYYEGEYHLFAQRWNKCWIHAVSPDLLHWTELEPAFWEEGLGEGVQSGNCVIDYENTSGLAPDKSKPAMIAFYSGADNRSQCLAYSLDRGRTWTKYANNPIIDFRERDPNVFWYAPAKHWVMLLYGDDRYHILTSNDLLHWKDEQKPLRDCYECPDFFELPVDGDPNHKKWVLIQGNGKYSVGTFNGTEFQEETPRFPCDVGDFYATQSWGNTETGDGRRIQAAWMRFSHFPEMPFSQQVTFPCELTLRTTPGGLRIFREPISEIASLHTGKTETWINREIRAGQTLPLAPEGRLFHIKADLEIPPGSKATFRLRGVAIELTSKTLSSDQRSADVQDQIDSVEILVDTTSVEVFVNDGELSFTRFALPGENGLSIRADGGSIKLRSLTVDPLRSAWTSPGPK